MPLYRSITLSLYIPTNNKEAAEYKPPPPPSFSPETTRNNNNNNNFQLAPPPTPSTNHSSGDNNPTDPFTSSSPPVTLLDIPRSIVSVYTNIHDLANFWLQYSIAPPYPPKLLYYFKLFINGTEVASWGCGEEEEWRGTTMWGIFAGDGQKRMERRGFCWAQQSEGGDGLMEVRVFRARGRMRVVPEVGRWEGLARGGKEIRLTKGGALPRKLPRRYYRYALLDSLDAPFATFRYYCRSLRQLDAIGVRDPLIECSTPTSTGSYKSACEGGQGPEDQHNPRDTYSPKPSSADTNSSESSGASDGEELLTRFASSGLESTTDVTKAGGIMTDPPSTPSKGKSEGKTQSTHTSPSPIRIPRPLLALVPKSSISSLRSLEAPPKDSPPLLHHNPLTTPTVPAAQNPSSPIPTILPPRSALFSPKPQHDPSKSATTVPARKPTPLPQRSAIFSPKPQAASPLSPPHRKPKPRSSREHFATMIREGFPSPEESARWKLGEERYGRSGHSFIGDDDDDDDDVPEPGGKGGGVVRDSIETERRRGKDGGVAEGKALKQGTLRKGLLKRVVGSRRGKRE